jgi:hypothetical protein
VCVCAYECLFVSKDDAFVVWAYVVYTIHACLVVVVAVVGVVVSMTVRVLTTYTRVLCRSKPNQSYREKAMVRDGKDDDWIDSWWTSFLKEHGAEKVAKVMKDAVVGVKPTGSNNDNSIATKNDNDSLPAKPLALGRTLPLEDDNFSACLLVKDDNDILNEWIAYHYHVLKLRTLVLASDPSSKTSPTVVLNRWRSHMDIREWKDADYMPDFFLQENYDLVPNLIGNMTNSTTSQFHDSNVNETSVRQELMQINNHRFRQATFFGSCIKHLKEHNKTWMVHVDTDEYIVMHHQVRKQDHWRKLELEPAIGPSSILKFLKTASSNYFKAMAYPCVSMPRLLFGSKEDGDLSSSVAVPFPFHATKFETLRWKYHSDYDALELNGKPKVILDLSGLPGGAHFLNPSKGVFSIHRPGLFMCRGYKDVLFNVSHKFPITVNHYIGSWERYSSRKDARRNWEVSIVYCFLLCRLNGFCHGRYILDWRNHSNTLCY